MTFLTRLVALAFALLLLAPAVVAGAQDDGDHVHGDDTSHDHDHGEGADHVHPSPQPTPLPTPTAGPEATPLPLAPASAPGQGGDTETVVPPAAAEVDASGNPLCAGSYCATLESALPVRQAETLTVDLDHQCDRNRVVLTAQELGFRELNVNLDGFDVATIRDLPGEPQPTIVHLGSGSLQNRGRSVDHEILVTSDEGALLAKAVTRGCVLASLEPSTDCLSINATLVNGGLRENPFALEVRDGAGDPQVERDFGVGNGASAAFQTAISEELSRSTVVIFIRNGPELVELDLGAGCGGVHAELVPSCGAAPALLTLRNVSPWDQVVDVRIDDGNDKEPLAVEVPATSSTEIGLPIEDDAKVTVTERRTNDRVLSSVIHAHCDASDLAGFSIWQNLDGVYQVGVANGSATPTQITLRHDGEVLESVTVEPNAVATVSLEGFEGGAITAQGSNGDEETLTLGEVDEGSGISDWLKGSTLFLLVGAALLFEAALLTVILPRRRAARDQALTT